VLICGSFGIYAIKISLNSNRNSAVQTSLVPPPPSSLAHRFGVYNWNIDDSAFPNNGSTDRLNWGADKVAEVGSRTIRVALTARDIYELGFPPRTELVEIVKHPAYDRLLRDPRFQTIMLTAYSFSDGGDNWSDGYTQAEYVAEQNEIRQLGEYLLSNPAFANKTFLVFNWEGDNAIYYHGNKRSVWDYYTNWIKARTEGVKQARQNHPSSSVRLYSGLEFNAVKSPKTGQPCGTPVADPIRNDPLQNRCLIDYVAPQVDVDYYSYSAWQSVNDKLGNPAESLKQRFKNDLGFALAKVKELRPGITENNFIVGEFGFERARYGECNSGNYINEMFDAFDGEGAFQASYVIFWQIADNAPSYGVGSEAFGLYRVRNQQLSISLLGETFRKRIAGESAAYYKGCPTIRRSPHSGVLTPEGNTDFRLNPDSLISIFAQGCCTNTETPFSPEGNIVHFEQGHRNYSLPHDHDHLFSESQTQINFSMPPDRRPGPARVSVTDARGIESNDQYIHINCADCPKISTSCGILDAEYQMPIIEPGNVAMILGNSFSPSGNTVTIEQQAKRQTIRRWTIPRDGILFESPTQINVRMPKDLVVGRETLICVVNGEGRESNDVGVTVAAPCSNCGPRFKPCQGVLNETGGLFYAGTVVSVFGRFPPLGNSVILEQIDQQNRVYKYSLTQGSPAWNESSRRVSFLLPPTMFGGRAMVYLVDIQTRETTAREFTISPSTVTTVSAASYRGPDFAPEAIVTAFSNAMATLTQDANSTPLPTVIGGTRVVIKDSAGVERDAPLFFVSPSQINYQVPGGAALGAGTATVISGFGSSSSGPLQIVNVAPGLFTANANGKGVAAAVALCIKPDGSRIFEPVAVFDKDEEQFVSVPIDLGPPGEEVFLILFGTGFRSIGDLSAATATISGINAEVTYVGPQGTLVGLDQINLRLPRSLGGKGELNVLIDIHGRSANAVKIMIK
jgi:uncharacterized protein (TIGR03437 family)